MLCVDSQRIWELVFPAALPTRFITLHYLNLVVQSCHLSLCLLNATGKNQLCHSDCTKSKNGRCGTPYLKVYRFHIMSQCVGPAKRLQHWDHLVWVVKVLDQFVDGIHDSVSMIPKLSTPLQLLRLLDVFKVTEVLLGWGEVHKQPGNENSWTLWARRAAAVRLGWSHSPQPAPTCLGSFFFFQLMYDDFSFNINVYHIFINYRLRIS